MADFGSSEHICLVNEFSWGEIRQCTRIMRHSFESERELNEALAIKLQLLEAAVSNFVPVNKLHYF